MPPLRTNYPPALILDHSLLPRSDMAFDGIDSIDDNGRSASVARLVLGRIDTKREVLMNPRLRRSLARLAPIAAPSLWISVITAILLMAGCAAESQSNGHVGLYAPGSKTDEDVDRELKFDARVQSYTAEGDKLVVNVNESFASAPPGIQQRALGHWYSLWQAARTPQNSKPQKDLEVVVRFEGNELAKWTRDEGFKPVQRAKAKGEDEDESDAESE
jgi:hypothetical protein